jgi:hypothetical protein
MAAGYTLKPVTAFLTKYRLVIQGLSQGSSGVAARRPTRYSGMMCSNAS